MALIKFGGGVVGMSGSVAGNTFARNRYGSYCRSRVKPTNPNTAGQQRARSIMTQCRDAWQTTLDATQRAGWAAYANGVAMKNKLGETVNLSGFNQFVRSTAALLNHALAIVEDAPGIMNLAEQDETIACSASEATGLISVTFSEVLPWALETGAYLLLAEGQPTNATINYYGGPWSQLGKVAGVDSTGAESPKTFASRYPLVEGQRVHVQARIVRLDGRLSEPFRVLGACGA